MKALSQGKITVNRLTGSHENRFTLEPDATKRGEIMRLLGLLDLRKLRLSGTMTASGRADWLLSATLGATAVQPCVVTAEPVTIRIDIKIRRLFVRDMPTPEEGSEVEFDGDDEHEPLGPVIDLTHVLTESLALALPQYPRRDGGEPDKTASFSAETPQIGGGGIKPFASLAALRDKLKE